MPGGWALLAIQALAMGQLLGTPTAGRPSLVQRVVLLVPGAALYAALTVAVEQVLAGNLVHLPADHGALGFGLMVLAPLALAAIGVLWVVLPAIATHPTVVAWRIHAGHGFYLPHVAERLIGTVRRSPPATTSLELSS